MKFGAVLFLFVAVIAVASAQQQFKPIAFMQGMPAQIQEVAHNTTQNIQKFFNGFPSLFRGHNH